MSFKSVLLSAAMILGLAGFVAQPAGAVDLQKDKCIQDVRTKYKGKLYSKEQKKTFLMALKKCQKKTESRYDQYYKVCKAFRVAQIKKLGKAKVLRKLKQCRLDAEVYEKSTNQGHLEPCEVKPCVLTNKLEMCVKSYQSMGSVGVADCRKLYAPLGCMLTPDEFNKRRPTTVLWNAGSVKGEILCSDI